MNFNSFAEAVQDTKMRIDGLKRIVDMLHTEFQGVLLTLLIRDWNIGRSNWISLLN